MERTRAELRKLADDKLRAARILMAERSFSNAYYLAGYAIEIGLKAVIARRFRANVFPDKKVVEKAYNHDFRQLVEVAELTAELAAARRDIRFEANWNIAAAWKAEDRYVMFDRPSANAMLFAVGDSDFGVHPWIKRFW
jgi:hypothetical protein